MRSGVIKAAVVDVGHAPAFAKENVEGKLKYYQHLPLLYIRKKHDHDLPLRVAAHDSQSCPSFPDNAKYGGPTNHSGTKIGSRRYK